jgi:hypothetical protein
VPISHAWANQMHYENTFLFAKEGVKRLASVEDKSGKPFSVRLALFCSFVSHTMADSFVHPAVNSIVGIPYILEKAERGKCELISDIYVFKKSSGRMS